MFNFNKIASELNSHEALQNYKDNFKNLIIDVFTKFSKDKNVEVKVELFLMLNMGYEEDCFNWAGFHKYKWIGTSKFSESIPRVLEFGKLLTNDINSYREESEIKCEPQKVIDYLIQTSQSKYL